MARRRELHEMVSPEPNTGCWIWLGAMQPNGYGIARRNKKTQNAHAFIYELLRGPHGQDDLDHKCRNRWCVNPDHMEPVSHRENLRRSNNIVGINARKTHCKRGHEFTPENTYLTTERGNRNCRQCMKERTAAWYLAHREETLARTKGSYARRKAGLIPKRKPAAWRAEIVASELESSAHTPRLHCEPVAAPAPVRVPTQSAKRNGTVYRTKGGVLVTIGTQTRFRHRSGRSMLKGDAYRVDTGGRHGWLWMHQLDRADSLVPAKGGAR